MMNQKKIFVAYRSTSTHPENNIFAFTEGFSTRGEASGRSGGGAVGYGQGCGGAAV